MFKPHPPPEKADFELQIRQKEKKNETNLWVHTQSTSRAVATHEMQMWETLLPDFESHVLFLCKAKIMTEERT